MVYQAGYAVAGMNQRIRCHPDSGAGGDGSTQLPHMA